MKIIDALFAAIVVSTGAFAPGMVGYHLWGPPGIILGVIFSMIFFIALYENVNG